MPEGVKWTKTMKVGRTFSGHGGGGPLGRLKRRFGNGSGKSIKEIVRHFGSIFSHSRVTVARVASSEHFSC